MAHGEEGALGALAQLLDEGCDVAALVAVTDGAELPLRMAELVARAEATAPALEDLLTSLAPDVAALAAALEEERV